MVRSHFFIVYAQVHETYITAVQKHNLLKAGTLFYDELQLLRQARNRAHIQNTSGKLAQDERAVYTRLAIKKAELCFEVVIKRMMTLYPRSNHDGVVFEDFPVPWSKHLEAKHRA